MGCDCKKFLIASLIFRIFLPTESDICLAVGVNKNYNTKSIFVRPTLECDKCRRCFIENKPSFCLVSIVFIFSKENFLNFKTLFNLQMFLIPKCSFYFKKFFSIIFIHFLFILFSFFSIFIYLFSTYFFNFYFSIVYLFLHFYYFFLLIVINSLNHFTIILSFRTIQTLTIGVERYRVGVPTVGTLRRFSIN